MDEFDYRPGARRRPPDPLEQRFDRLMSAGRQLVDGVSGARPGSRQPGRAQGAAPLPRLGDLGRWVESRLDGLLDDDDDNWREPWQNQPAPAPEPTSPRRRPLEALSRRGQPAPAGRVSDRAGVTGEDWPDDASFRVPRWQRDPRPQPEPQPQPEPPRSQAPAGTGTRPLPRSSRRRAD